MGKAQKLHPTTIMNAINIAVLEDEDGDIII